MRRYWIGVASRDHVLAAIRGGFCQMNHGKAAPLTRMHPGDRLLYYSPKTGMREGSPVQAFTAIGAIVDGEPYQAIQSERFHPFRRDVRYFDGQDAPIAPLLPHLSFSRENASWGHVLRRGIFRVPVDDYRLIAKAMQVRDEVEP